MEKHGSESYFVLGEGLLGESGEGRTLAVAAKAAPPFRFSRMGPKGTGRQPSRAIRKKLGELMAAGGGETSDIPSGFTYLGQFIDHDLTFDKTNVMLGTHVAPTALLQARSPSLDLDSLYGAGPQDPESAKFYEADGMHLKTGTTEAIDGIAAKPGFDLPRGAGSTQKAKRKAIIPDPRNDENLAVAQTHCAMIRFHNRVLDTLPASVPAAQRFATARELVTKHYQWMIKTDYLPRVCRPSAVNNVFNSRPQGVRGRRHADRRPHHADRVQRRRVPARALDGARDATTGTRSSTWAPGASTCCSRSRPPAATSAASCTCRATGSPTSAGSTTSARPARPT